MMKKTTNLVKYQLQIYFGGSSLVMPAIFTAIFLYLMYSTKPLYIVSGFLISSTFIYLLMIWIGLTVAANENVVTEQLMLLRVQSSGYYYSSKVIFLMCITLFFSILCTGIPVMINVINGYDLFVRGLLISDVGNAFLLHLGCGFAGATLGNLMHPRVMKDRNIAIILTVFFAILSVVQKPIIEVLPILKGILWILPPIMLPAERYGNAEYFQWGHTLVIFIVLMLYGAGYSVIKSVICNKNKF